MRNAKMSNLRKETEQPAQTNQQQPILRNSVARQQQKQTGSKNSKKQFKVVQQGRPVWHDGSTKSDEGTSESHSAQPRPKNNQNCGNNGAQAKNKEKEQSPVKPKGQGQPKKKSRKEFRSKNLEQKWQERQRRNRSDYDYTESDDEEESFDDIRKIMTAHLAKQNSHHVSEAESSDEEQDHNVQSRSDFEKELDKTREQYTPEPMTINGRELKPNLLLKQKKEAYDLAVSIEQLVDKDALITKEREDKMKFKEDETDVDHQKRFCFPYQEELPKIYSKMQRILRLFVGLAFFIQTPATLAAAISQHEYFWYGLLMNIACAIIFCLIRPSRQLPLIQLELENVVPVVHDNRGDQHKHHQAKHSNYKAVFRYKLPHSCPKFKINFESNSILDKPTQCSRYMKDLILDYEEFPCKCKFDKGRIYVLTETADQIMSTLVRRGTNTTIGAFIDSGVGSHPFSIYSRNQNTKEYHLGGTSDFLRMNFARYDVLNSAFNQASKENYSCHFQESWSTSLLQLSS